MAVVVDVLKLTQVQGVCAVRGTAATGTIALATTLKKSTETQSSPKADIKAIHWTLSASASARSHLSRREPQGRKGRLEAGCQKTKGTMLSFLLAQTWLTFLQNQI